MNILYCQLLVDISFSLKSSLTFSFVRFWLTFAGQAVMAMGHPFLITMSTKVLLEYPLFLGYCDCLAFMFSIVITFILMVKSDKSMESLLFSVTLDSCSR